MKKIIIFGLWSILTTYLFSQTSSSNVKTGSTSSRTTGTSQFGRDRTSSQRREVQEEMYGQISSMIASVIGSKLRHPDPEIRKQALMSLVYSMGATQEGGRGSQEGIRSIFYFGEEGRGREGATGAGGATYIPDLYELLQDPDPEVRDLAAVGLDILFNTEMTLLKFMQDEDPLVRKYAVRIYSERSLGSERERGGREREYEYAAQLLALRTLLVRLKYEKEPAVRKAISDAIEEFLITGGREGGRRSDQLLGVDQSIINYLNDENPVVRKNALKIIANMEYNPVIFNTLLERLKVEKDEEVRTLIEQTIEILSSGIEQGGRRTGIAPAGGIR